MTPEAPDVALRRELGLLTEEDIAALAGVAVKTVQEWRTERRGPPFTKLGTKKKAARVLYRIEAVRKWLREQEEATEG